MNANDILDMVGDAREKYVWDAQNVRSGAVAVSRKRPSIKRTLLIAAMVALMLLLVGCAIACARGWFVDFFANQSRTPLSDSQIALIEQNEQQIHEADTHNGWTVELRSALKDNNKAYIMIGITAPDGVDLEPEVVDGVLTEQFSPGNVWPASDEDNPPAIVTYPEGVMPFSVQTSWQEDGDGRENTKNYVMELEPDIAASSVDPFGADARWKIHIENIVRTYDDEAYRQELLNTKYKGDYAVMFTHEETLRMKQKEVLAEGIWDFTVTFAEQTQGPQEMELLSSPIQTTAEIPWRYGDQLWEVAVVRKDITVTSILLQSLSAKVSYDPCGGYPNFYLDDGDIDRSNNIYACCVLKDGSQIILQDFGSGGDGYKLLEAESPIVMEEVHYVRLPDGTKVYTDGTVEPGTRPEHPAAARDYQSISSDTGVYFYYADFDGDAVEDMAVWYGGAFRALCLLDEAGHGKKTFIFENGVDIYETYNQRAAEINHEPNLIRVSEGGNGAETIRYFRAEADGLHLDVGIKCDPGAAETKWFRSQTDDSVVFDASSESWAVITEESYRRIAEDYQVMGYRLIPAASNTAT